MRGGQLHRSSFHRPRCSLLPPASCGLSRSQAAVRLLRRARDGEAAPARQLRSQRSAAAALACCACKPLLRLRPRLHIHSPAARRRRRPRAEAGGRGLALRARDERSASVRLRSRPELRVSAPGASRRGGEQGALEERYDASRAQAAQARPRFALLCCLPPPPRGCRAATGRVAAAACGP